MSNRIFSPYQLEDSQQPYHHPRRQDLRSLQVIVYMFRYVMLVNNCDYLFQSICYVVNKRFFTISYCFRSIETSLLEYYDCKLSLLNALFENLFSVMQRMSEWSDSSHITYVQLNTSLAVSGHSLPHHWGQYIPPPVYILLLGEEYQYLQLCFCLFWRYFVRFFMYSWSKSFRELKNVTQNQLFFI